MLVSDEQIGKIIEVTESISLRPIDPFRPYLQFLVGLIAFSLAIIVTSMTVSFEKINDQNVYLAAMSGGILAWMAITAVLATFGSLLIQYRKACSIRAPSGTGSQTPAKPGLCEVGACLLPSLTGLVATLFAVRGGFSLLENAGGGWGYFAFF